MSNVIRHSETLTIEIWSDFVCPFCYMGQRNLKAGIAMWGGHVEIVYKSFPLMSDLAPGSDTKFLEMFGRQRNLQPEQVRNIMDGVTKKAATLGLEFRLDRARATNTHCARRNWRILQNLRANRI